MVYTLLLDNLLSLTTIAMSFFGPPDVVLNDILACVNKKYPDIMLDDIQGLWDDALSRNQLIISILKDLGREYEVSTDRNDRFRAISYKKAVNILSKVTIPIISGKQAMALEGIGKRIGDKIDEILKTGKLSYIEKRTEETKER